MKEFLKDKWLIAWLGYLIITCALLCFPEVWAFQLTGSGVAATGGGSTAYFGSSLCVTGTSLIATPSGGSFANLNTEGSVWNADITIPWTCPGSGTKHVKVLKAWLKSGGGVAGNMRMAVYTASSSDPGTLMCQGNSAVSVSSTTESYVGHSDAGITETTALTGGQNYLIVLSLSNGDAQVYSEALTDGGVYGPTQYTTGFPASFAGTELTARNYALVCGVQ
jgi:hypothetical protein